MHEKRFDGTVERLRAPEWVVRLDVERVVSLCLEFVSLHPSLHLSNNNKIRSKIMDFLSHLFNRSTINQVEPAQVKGMISQSPRPFLLDVRTPAEYKQGHVSGAELIPLDELSAKMSRIPKDRDVICICESGSRSSVAARQLSSQGYKVSNMRGGMSRWIRAGLPVKQGMVI
jgi:rhodanese-related sulfurtransferase